MDGESRRDQSSLDSLKQVDGRVPEPRKTIQQLQAEVARFTKVSVEKLPVSCGMNSPIAVSLHAYQIANADISLLSAVLTGLEVEATQHPELVLSCLSVSIVDPSEPETPLILQPGFVAFAKALHAAHPNFPFFADLSDDFLRHYIMALSGNIKAVQSGTKGRIEINGIGWVTFAASSTDRTYEIGIQFGAPRQVMEIHREDMSQYLGDTSI